MIKCFFSFLLFPIACLYLIRITIEEEERRKFEKDEDDSLTKEPQ